MAEKKKEAQYAPPASQVDLEQRLASGNASGRIVSTSDDFKGAEDDGKARDYRVEGNEIGEYVGVSPEYATYANETEAPHATPEENPEAQVFENFAQGLAPEVPEGWELKDSKAEVTTEPADSGLTETEDGAPVPQSATTDTSKVAPKKTASSSS